MGSVFTRNMFEKMSGYLEMLVLNKWAQEIKYYCAKDVFFEELVPKP